MPRQANWRENGEPAEALQHLHSAGWSIGSAAFAAVAGGLVWVVSGKNGENFIRTEGATDADAWRGAVGQARSVGMLGGWRVSEPGAV